jgi:hypothetical protein
VFVPEGVCSLLSTNQGPVIAFAACDFAFSFLLLTLFAYPLHRHVRSVTVTAEDDSKLIQLLRKSLILSTLISCSTVTSLIGMAVIWTMHGEHADRSEQFWHIYALFLPSCDMVFSACVGLLMTNSWMPKSVLAFTRYLFRLSEDETSTKKSSKNDPNFDHSKSNNNHTLVITPGSSFSTLS